MADYIDEIQPVNITVNQTGLYYVFNDGSWSGVWTGSPPYSTISTDGHSIATATEPAYGNHDYWRKQLPAPLTGNFIFNFELDWILSNSTQGVASEGNKKMVFGLSQNPLTDWSSFDAANDGLVCSIVSTPDSPSGTYRRIRLDDLSNTVGAGTFYPVTTPWGVSYPNSGGLMQIERNGTNAYFRIFSNDGTPWGLPVKTFALSIIQPFNYIYAHSSWGWGDVQGSYPDNDTYTVSHMWQEA